MANVVDADAAAAAAGAGAVAAGDEQDGHASVVSDEGWVGVSASASASASAAAAAAAAAAAGACSASFSAATDGTDGVGGDGDEDDDDEDDNDDDNDENNKDDDKDKDDEDDDSVNRDGCKRARPPLPGTHDAAAAWERNGAGVIPFPPPPPRFGETEHSWGSSGGGRPAGAMAAGMHAGCAPPHFSQAPPFLSYPVYHHEQQHHHHQHHQQQQHHCNPCASSQQRAPPFEQDHHRSEEEALATTVRYYEARMRDHAAAYATAAAGAAWAAARIAVSSSSPSSSVLPLPPPPHHHHHPSMMSSSSSSSIPPECSAEDQALAAAHAASVAVTRMNAATATATATTAGCTNGNGNGNGGMLHGFSLMGINPPPHYTPHASPTTAAAATATGGCFPTPPPPHQGIADFSDPSCRHRSSPYGNKPHNNNHHDNNNNRYGPVYAPLGRSLSLNDTGEGAGDAFSQYTSSAGFDSATFPGSAIQQHHHVPYVGHYPSPPPPQLYLSSQQHRGWPQVADADVNVHVNDGLGTNRDGIQLSLGVGAGSSPRHHRGVHGQNKRHQNTGNVASGDNRTVNGWSEYYEGKRNGGVGRRHQRNHRHHHQQKQQQHQQQQQQHRAPHRPDPMDTDDDCYAAAPNSHNNDNNNLSGSKRQKWSQRHHRGAGIYHHHHHQQQQQHHPYSSDSGEGGGGNGNGNGIGGGRVVSAAETRPQRTLWYPPKQSRPRQDEGGPAGPGAGGRGEVDDRGHVGDVGGRHQMEDRRGRRRNRDASSLGGGGGSSSGGGGGGANAGQVGGTGMGLSGRGEKKGRAASVSGGVESGHGSTGSGGSKWSGCGGGGVGVGIGGIGGPKPFNPVGRTGISALHELCDKRHWDAPRFEEVDQEASLGSFGGCGVGVGIGVGVRSPSPSPTSAASATAGADDFVIAVRVNGRELGRGRGGTKASARQDAARRAVAALMPGVTFDANGILIDLGDIAAPASVSVSASARSRGSSVAAAATSASPEDDLAPTLASRLAIDAGAPRDTMEGGEVDGGHEYDDDDGGAGGACGRAPSPAPSDADSSISTAVSGTRSASSGGGGRLDASRGSRGAAAAAAAAATTAIGHECGVVVTGGPGRRSRKHHTQQQRRRPDRVYYPCASATTSAASSAEEAERGDVDGGASGADGSDDPDAYYASRGASVCSALLHAMAQIDARIREPPAYTFDLRANPASSSMCDAAAAASAAPLQHVAEAEAAASASKSAKRKGAGAFGGCAGAIASKRRSATTAVGTSVTVHRSTFACTASLVLHLPGSDAAETKTTSVEYKPPMLGAGGGGIEVHGEGAAARSDVGGNAPSGRLDLGGECGAAPPSPPTLTPTPKEEERQLRLEAVGTGATKREARHTASARLLALLFPECRGMAEVKAAAEAARERYAAAKALSRQSKRALSLSSGGSAGGGRRDAQWWKGGQDLSQRKGRNFSGASAEVRGAKGDTAGSGVAESVSPRDGDLPIPESIAYQIASVAGLEWPGEGEGFTRADHEMTAAKSCSADGLVDVASLSLSEPGERVMSVANPRGIDEPQKEPRTGGDVNGDEPESSSLRQAARQRQLEEEADAALQALQECEDEQRRVSCCPASLDDDVGRTVLRRAGPEDGAWVKELLLRSGKTAAKKDGRLRGRRVPPPSNPASSVGPLSLIGLSRHALGDRAEGDEDMAGLASLLWGANSIVLLLARAVAACDEPPLGCAVLSLGFSLSQGRTLRISDVAHREHLPKERFVEILDAFASKMACNLDSGKERSVESALTCRRKTSVSLAEDEMRELVQDYTTRRNEKINAGRPTLHENDEREYDGESATVDSSICLRGSSSVLQSVKEEENEEEEEPVTGKEDKGELDGGSERESLRGHPKPSKRSRVA